MKSFAVEKRILENFGVIGKFRRSVAMWRVQKMEEGICTD